MGFSKTLALCLNIDLPLLLSLINDLSALIYAFSPNSLFIKYSNIGGNVAVNIANLPPTSFMYLKAVIKNATSCGENIWISSITIFEYDNVASFSSYPSYLKIKSTNWSKVHIVKGKLSCFVLST